MTGIVVDIKPSSEFILAADAIVQALNRLAAAMEAGKAQYPTAATLYAEKPAMSPERLAALRANAEKARAAKVKLTALADLPAPITATPTPVGAILDDQRPKPVTQTRIDVMRQVAASIPKPNLSPIEADFSQVQTWAVQRGMSFGIWDDLPLSTRGANVSGYPHSSGNFPLRAALDNQQQETTQ